MSDVKDLPGYGMTATAGGDRWLAGTLRLLDRENVSYPEELKSVPETIVACAKNGRYEATYYLPTRLRTTRQRPSEGSESAE